MVKNDLTLNIGTKYTDDGLKKLDTQLKQSSKTVNDASKAIGAISGELGQMSGSAGKAAQAISGLFSALTAGGPVAVVIAALTAGVSLLVKAFNDAKERAKDAADYMRDAFSKSFEASSQKIKTIFSDLPKSLAENNFITQMVSKHFKLESRKKILDTRNQALDEREGMTSKYDIARSKAQEEYDVAIAQAKENSRQYNVSAQNTKDEVSEREKNLNKAIHLYGENAVDLEIRRLTIEQRKDYREYQRLLKEAESAMTLMREKGEDAIVGKKTINVVTGVSGFGGAITPAISPQAVSITAKETYEEAAAALKEFEKSNKSLVDDVNEFNNQVKTLQEDNKIIDELQDQLAKAKVLKDSVDNESKLTEEEYETIKKQLNEKLQEQLKAIDEQEKAEKERIKKEQDRIKKEEERKKNAEKIAQLDKELERIQNQDKKTAVQRLEEHKKEQKAAKELAEAEKKAAEVLTKWKNNTDQSFGKWLNGQNAADRAADRAARKKQKNAAQAEDAAKKIAGRIFDENGNLMGRANAMDIGRFAQASDFLGFGNITDEQLETLQQRRDALRSKLFNADGTLKKGVNAIGQDVGMFKQLDKALKNIEAVKDAEKQRKDAEEREKKRAENEDKRTKAVDEINGQIKELRKKMEI